MIIFHLTHCFIKEYWALSVNYLERKFFWVWQTPPKQGKLKNCCLEINRKHFHSRFISSCYRGVLCEKWRYSVTYKWKNVKIEISLPPKEWGGLATENDCIGVVLYWNSKKQGKGCIFSKKYIPGLYKISLFAASSFLLPVGSCIARPLMRTWFWFWTVWLP